MLLIFIGLGVTSFDAGKERTVLIYRITVTGLLLLMVVLL